MRVDRLPLILLLCAALVILPPAILLYLTTVMPGESLQGELPPLSAEQELLRDRLQSHVRVLAEQIGPRHAEVPDALNQAADYILEELRSYGYAPMETHFGEGRFRNVSAELPGLDRPEQLIVVGAHYDTASNGTPGADDNASGVAALLEIARLLAGREFPRAIRFIAFPNEESPFFGTELMGSRASARLSAERGEQIAGMLSLEMLGYYSSERSSQHYPPLIRHLYPEQGNFIAFVANFSSRAFLRQAIRAFRGQGLFPSEGMAAPEAWVRDIRRSDNSSYWDYGFPAVMVTDTSNFRTPYYHTLDDTADTLDYEAMSRVVQGLSIMVRALAEQGSSRQ